MSFLTWLGSRKKERKITRRQQDTHRQAITLQGTEDTTRSQQGLCISLKETKVQAECTRLTYIRRPVIRIIRQDTHFKLLQGRLLMEVMEARSARGELA